jgi:uncharacterized damage-inducible protein DinB
VKQSDILLLFEYNYWANGRILAAASKISPEQFVAPTAFPRGSLRSTLLHILDAEYGWRELLDHRREVPDLAAADFPTIAAIEAFWSQEEAGMRQYLVTLTDETLTAVVRYTNLQGIQRQRVLWHGLFHVVNHGTQHRSEAAAMLTDFGQSPGDVDFSIFTIEHLQPSS